MRNTTRKGIRSMRQLSFLAATTITISSIFMQQATANDVVFKTGEPQYQASYNVDTSNPSNPEIHIQLELLNYDITNWFQYNQTTTMPLNNNTNSTDNSTNTTDGSNNTNPNPDLNNQSLPGVLFGIGFGSQTFGNSDLIVCNFTQDMMLSKTSFDCFDYRVDENGTVYLDDQQDVRAVFTQYPFSNRTITTNIETTDPTTNVTTVTTTNSTKADFIVSFIRSLNTNDSTDFVLTQTVVDAYWVYGPITGNELNITQHLENADDFGSTQLDLTPPAPLQSGNTDNTPSSGALALISQSFAMVAALSLVIFH